MRRTIAISLLMLFSWGLIAPVLAPDSEANLPACCRRNGKHHCAMRIMAVLDNSQRGFTTITDKCPCYPASASVVHSSTFKPEARDAVYAEARHHLARAPQTEALYRVSLLRSHQKRGPPPPLA